MKLALVLVIMTSLASLGLAAHQNVQKLIAIEGVYDIVAEYTEQGQTTTYKPLTSLVISRHEVEERFHVMLAEDSGEVFLYILNMNHTVFPDGRIVLMGEGESRRSGIYGELKVILEPKSGKLEARFIDSIASGYKVIRGTRRYTVEDVLANGAKKISKSEKIEALYEGRVGKFKGRMIIREYEQEMSAFFDGDANGVTLKLYYSNGTILRDQGISRYRGHFNHTGFPTNLVLVKVADGKLKGLHWAPNGRYLVVDMVRVADVQHPADWTTYGTR